MIKSLNMASALFRPASHPVLIAAPAANSELFSGLSELLKRRSHNTTRKNGRLYGSGRAGLRCSAVATQPVQESTVKKPFAVKQRRVVVTGMGVVSCLGHDPTTFYDNLLAGTSGISEIQGFDISDYPTVSAIFRVFMLETIIFSPYLILNIAFLRAS